MGFQKEWKEKVEEIMFDETKAKNFPKFLLNNNLHIHQAQLNPRKKNAAKKKKKSETDTS